MKLANAFQAFERVRGSGDDGERGLAVARRRHLDVAVVVDAGAGVAVWKNSLDRLVTALEAADVFRAVDRWQVVVSERGAAEVGGRLRLQNDHGDAWPPERLVDPSGRRLVLLATDAVADHWAEPDIWRALTNWARRMPTSIVHMLPAQYWSSTALGLPDAAARAASPAAPNEMLDVDVAWWSAEYGQVAEGGREAPLSVPVLTLDSTSVREWAAAVVDGSGWVASVTLPGQPSVAAVSASQMSVAAADIVFAFRARASQAAVSLAELVASAPLLSLPLIDLLQSRFAPETGPLERAEVFVNGLLEPAYPPGTGGSPEHYRFRAGVAAALRPVRDRVEDWATLEAVNSALAEGTVEEAERGPFVMLAADLTARLGVPDVARQPPRVDDLDHTSSSQPPTAELAAVDAGETPGPAARSAARRSSRAESAPEQPDLARVADMLSLLQTSLPPVDRLCLRRAPVSHVVDALRNAVEISIAVSLTSRHARIFSDNRVDGLIGELDRILIHTPRYLDDYAHDRDFSVPLTEDFRIARDRAEKLLQIVTRARRRDLVAGGALDAGAAYDVYRSRGDIRAILSDTGGIIAALIGLGRLFNRPQKGSTPLQIDGLRRRLDRTLGLAVGTIAPLAGALADTVDVDVTRVLLDQNPRRPLEVNQLRKIATALRDLLDEFTEADLTSAIDYPDLRFLLENVRWSRKRTSWPQEWEAGVMYRSKRIRGDIFVVGPGAVPVDDQLRRS
ncbi:hypothetical protein I6A60_09330 [Frankia sp. AgB1.9]|uniref:SAV_2336 N-terminal domain-related protein n=3 Tax=Frankia TaxID=1854 RepID=UPI001933B32E|nr:MULTISPECIES: SAV_2336 N-terminal domain-related protein [unclassified Frankia]MBL7548075.1 hypothetical protein [Frankia sp. AgB1.9]